MFKEGVSRHRILIWQCKIRVSPRLNKFLVFMSQIFFKLCGHSSLRPICKNQFIRSFAANASCSIRAVIWSLPHLRVHSSGRSTDKKEAKTTLLISSKKF